MKYGELSLGQIEAIVNKLGGMDGVRRLLSGELVVQPPDLTVGDFEILVDYTQTLEAMIAAGRYDWANSDITAKRFPVEGEGKVTKKAKLYHFNRSMTSEEVIRELDKQGKRPATIEELLAFGAQHPEIQRQFPVVALGSSAEVGGCRYVAYLRRFGSLRHLLLRYWNGDWRGCYRFLAFDK